VKFKTHQYTKHWTATVPSSTDLVEVEEARKARQKLENLLAALLISDNLVIVTGLGTSLCVKDAAKNSIAPTMGDLWDLVKSANKDFDAILTNVHHPKNADGSWKIDAEALLSRCQMAVELEDDASIRSFIATTETVIVKACNFLSLLPAGAGLPIHTAFLRKIATRPTRLQRAKLFTTNYDLCFETAVAAAGFIVIDGFSHTVPQEFDGIHFNYDIVRRSPDLDVPSFVPNVFQLLKLHGSIDWDRTPTGRVLRASVPKNPVMIYPRSGKFESSYTQPYFEMMSRFQAALRSSNTGVLIVGFGFNDAHIVGPLRSAIQSNSSLRLISVGPTYESKPPVFVKELEDLILAGDRRISLIAGGFEDLTEAIPDLAAQSEDDLHQLRMKRVP
jgi:hypothetical protein